MHRHRAVKVLRRLRSMQRVRGVITTLLFREVSMVFARHRPSPPPELEAEPEPEDEVCDDTHCRSAVVRGDVFPK